MSDNNVTISEWMEGCLSEVPKEHLLPKDQQYKKVIEELVRQLMKATNGKAVWLAPHTFGEPDSLTCWVDERGNAELTAMKSVCEPVI